MSMAVTASEQDLRTLAAIVTDDREDLPAQGLPPSLLSELMDQIRCDSVSLQGFDSGRQQVWFNQPIPYDGDYPDDLAAALDQAHWEHYWHSEPCSYPDRTGDLRSVVTIADFCSARQWRSSGMYADVYRPQGLSTSCSCACPNRRDGPPGPGGPSGCTSSAGPARTFPSVTERC